MKNHLGSRWPSRCRVILLGVLAGSGVHASIRIAASASVRYALKTSQGLLAQTPAVVTV